MLAMYLIANREVVSIPMPREMTKSTAENIDGNESRGTSVPLDAASASGKLPFSAMWTAPIITEETQREFDFPQREAAFFYGLFLRGHSAAELRRDIEVPPAVLARWHREGQRDPGLKDVFERMVDYRRHVLAIFEALVGYDTHVTRVQ